MHPSQIEKLGNFALQYTKEIPEYDWNEELLRNIAHLLLRFSRFQQSIDLCDALLLKRPEDNELSNLKALSLMSSREPNNLKVAKDIFTNIVNRFPEADDSRFNLALTLSLLEDGDEAVKQMKILINKDFWTQQDLLSDVNFHFVREQREEQFKELKECLEQREEAFSNKGKSG